MDGNTTRTTVACPISESTPARRDLRHERSAYPAPGQAGGEERNRVPRYREGGAVQARRRGLPGGPRRGGGGRRRTGAGEFPRRLRSVAAVSGRRDSRQTSF